MPSPSAQDNDFIVVAQSQQSDAPAEHDDADQDQGTYTRQQIQQISTYAKIPSFILLKNDLIKGNLSSFHFQPSEHEHDDPPRSLCVRVFLRPNAECIVKLEEYLAVLDNTEWGRADWLVFEEVLGISDSDEGQRRFKYRGYYSVNKEYVPTTRGARGLQEQEQMSVSVSFIVEKAADSLPLAASNLLE
ncbi:hypothetical protein D9758_017495 [Tetrapyrgos nigripes]|uniref:Uncharacterized protein n=1 Tax=Tetrapyrgos nigripes TaxID=182062 RepID=A0A8H5C0R5_9AGAR|nr:hypothetical protein D9758_017495 [Tetrapyrgos nigripes]